ncbi:RING-H2 finger protein ATL56 [Malania oleifera]|uniref:RING-H2 finger protein ATL56 n=1 Tax=Malania oleifera TaxID=397392 RepID=UPI0025AE58A9|nr:RING-H2 finger protein ATL56 [Malania oleifera]
MASQEHRGRRSNPSPSTGVARRLPPPSSAEKRSPRLLSFVLKAVVMAFVTTLFFLFVGVAAILLLHLCLAGGAFRRRRPRHRSPNFGESDPGYSPEELSKLHRARYVACAAPERADDCVVCLSALRDGEWCRVLPGCNHIFHADCVDKWLIKVPFCPICRGRVRLNSETAGSAIGGEETKQHLWLRGCCG